MVRVCLYLALALGLAGSASAADCTFTNDMTAANGFEATGATFYTTTANAGKDCPLTLATVKVAEACTIKCKAGYFLGSDVRKSLTDAWVVCNDAGVLSEKPTCTACTAVESMTVNAAEPTCTSATNSQVTSCLTGYSLDSTGDAYVCTAWKSQPNCDVDAATQQGTGAYLACTTAKAGYKVTAGEAVACVSDLYFGMKAFNSKDKPSKATGVTCKNDGTVIRIPSCPAGTFKTAGTATTSDTCTACLDTGKSRCHCTGATAALCLATGSCAEGYTGYEGDGAGKASKSTGCKACKACTGTSTASKVAQWTSADCTTSSDYGCTDCPAVATNGKKAGASCYNAAFTNNACVTNFAQKPGDRATSNKNGGDSNKFGCGKSTCVCPEGYFTAGTAAAPTCTQWTPYANDKYQTTPGSATVQRVLAACPTSGAGYQAACATAGQFKTLGATAGTDESGDSCTATLDHKCTACTTCSATSGIVTAESTTGWASACVLDNTAGTANELAGSDTVCSMPKLDHTWTAYEAIARTYKIYGASATANPVTTSGEVIVTTDAACTVANKVTGSAGTEADIASSGTAQTTSAAESPAVTTSIAITNAATVYLCMRAAISTVATNYFKVGTITVVAIGKSCLVQEWTNSHGGKCDVTNAGAQNGESTPGGSTLEYLQPIRKSGYTAACTVTCDKTLGPFTVDTSTAVECTKQKGCTTAGSTGDCADDGNSDPNLKKWHTYRACTAVDAGYYLGEDTTDVSTTGSYDVVKSCVGAGQSTLNKDGKTSESCDDACWYTAACKSGFTKTVGMGVSDTCVSDSAASVSLTAVLLSVVAKIFLF